MQLTKRTRLFLEPFAGEMLGKSPKLGHSRSGNVGGYCSPGYGIGLVPSPKPFTWIKLEACGELTSRSGLPGAGELADDSTPHDGRGFPK